MKPYKYEELPASKKRIRLLQLEAGTIQSPAIYCKLIEADYNNRFHIPTRATDNDKDEGLHGIVDKVRESEIKYQALSWCWGKGDLDYTVIIEQGKESYKKRVKKDLAMALKYLRRPNKRRMLWIDAICINQDDPEERNQQVQMMSRIYTRAQKVCIWLGEDSDESELAFNFIREEITQLRNFDKISSDKNYSDKWRALMMLMQREWFSRRWVVQEISLAKKAKIYCGPYSIQWKEFAVAVELFVEVETATHRLSEVMQNDEKFRHVPGWFEYVSELGASLLVKATGKVFRAHGTPMDDDEDDLKEPLSLAKFVETVHTIDPLDRRSLLSLEYLVTTMFIFKASECRDSIYSMLAIARDAAPFAETTGRSDAVSISMNLFDCFLAEKPFMVDYSRPYSDVCRDFVEFCILRKSILDPIQALDILCRPWALEPQQGKSIRLAAKNQNHSSQSVMKVRLVPKRQSQWQKRSCKARLNVSTFTWTYEKADDDEWVDDTRNMLEYVEQKLRLEKQEAEKSRTCHAQTWKRPKNWSKVESFITSHKMKTEGEVVDSDVKLPSWVARAKNAPFKLFSHPGIHIHKTGRANADPLVGTPRDGHRSYSAAQTKHIDMDSLKFKKRPHMGHYSLYVAGFELDEVEKVTDASQGGNIPRSWLDLSNWNPPYKTDPPAEFWRTIVADRGQENRNPPYYYARACKESVLKGGIASGMVNTTALINNERNSIIAEFCRRVHAVIWGRSLFRTKKGQLGIAAKGVKAGDKICILYGCTVPVILSKQKKEPEERENEQLEDQFEAFRSCMRRLENICLRKSRYNARKEKKPGWEEEVTKDTAQVNQLLYLFKQQREQYQRQSKERQEIMRKRLTTENQTSYIFSFWPRLPKLSFPFWNSSNNGGSDDGSEVEEPVGDEYFHYVFKGESYVHGCMDGEALRSKFYEDTQERIFELR
ncbi:heterokaryon incompatibility protein-domain-containing protein [Phaeosphaeriaceae sp. PMI808]|nr:heterokaryon incompatibility protein-domain-containing protein [Phaeosphaeriaceae sp. PMI808]